MPANKKTSFLILRITLIFTIIFYTRASAQEMTGISNTKYNAIHSVILNPALTVLSPFYLDLNLVSFHAFIENDYIYVRKEEDKFKKFLKGDLAAPYQTFYFDYYTPSLKKGYINLRATGPSAALIVGKNAFGLSFSLRSVTSFRNIPMPVAKFFYEGLYFPPQYDVRFDQNERMSFANLEWAEIALNYSRILSDQGTDVWAIGGTLKIMPGYAGAYAFSRHVDFEVPNYDTLIIYDADIEAGISFPVNYNDDHFQKKPLIRGFGAGMDLGLVYFRKKTTGKNNPEIRHLCAQQYNPYYWRVGISLLDFGSIRFNRNSRKLNVNHGSFEWPGINSLQYTSVNGLISEISNRFFNNPDEIVSDNKFAIVLPSAISVQGDFNFHGNWFVSGVGFLPVRISNAQAMRSLLVSGGLRYESRAFQVGTSVSFTEMGKPDLGFNARISNFFFGSENMLSFFKTSDFTGTDLYAGIKFSFLKGKCRRSPGIECDFKEYQKFKKREKNLKIRPD